MSAPLEYHTLLRGGSRPVWWGLLGIPMVLGLVFVIASFLSVIPFAAWFVITGQPLGDGLVRLSDLSNPEPISLAYLNVVLATSIPATWLAIRGLHGLRPRWLSSVRPRIRWDFFLVCLGLSLIVLVATVWVSSVLPSGEAGAEVSGQLNPWTRQTRDFVLVVVLLTPLQAAGEEYLFRGYLTQAVGSMADTALGRTATRALAVLVPAVLFALFHGAGQSMPVFLDRFAFGLVAGILVLVTGGLEAGIAMHVLNNFVAYGVALAFGDMGSALVPTGGSWWMLPSTLVQSLLFLALATAAARGMGLQRTVDPAELVAPAGLVYRS